MPKHDAQIIGLAGFTLIGSILEELESMNRGTKARILANAKAACQAEAANNPGGNAAAMLAVINEI